MGSWYRENRNLPVDETHRQTGIQSPNAQSTTALPQAATFSTPHPRVHQMWTLPPGNTPKVERARAADSATGPPLGLDDPEFSPTSAVGKFSRPQMFADCSAPEFRG